MAKSAVEQIEHQEASGKAADLEQDALYQANLSQARLGSLEKDLGMEGTDYNLATSILFVGYLLMQLPSNLLLTRVRPSLFLGIAMAIWGVISACQAAVQSFSGLVVTRFFLGFVEAPFFPGAVMLMSSWYTRKELSHRIAWFYAGSSLANAFGGLIGAGVLGNLDGAHGIDGWRWLFIIEGVITIGVSLLAAIFLPNYPATTSWLDAQEQSYAQWRLIADAGEADDAKSTSFKEALALVFADKRIYLFILLQHTSLLSQNFQYFFPTIVQTLGYNNIQTLLITAPVWIATFLISLLVTWTSGKTDDRSLHIIALMLVSVVGGIICTATTNTGARFFAMFLMPMGAVSAYQIILAWVANSFPRPLVKRSAAIALANMIGNTASIYGSYMWPASSGPRYLPGGSATAAIALVVALVALVIRLVHARMNKQLEAAEASQDLSVDSNDPESRTTGFRYILVCQREASVKVEQTSPLRQTLASRHNFKFESALVMAKTYDKAIPFGSADLEVTGLFKRGKSVGKDLPLIVLIHGGAVNAAYFDNSSFSYPAILSERGHNVLNIQRSGYGDNPIPRTQTPIIHSIPVITNLIGQVYRNEVGNQEGVIIFGHSLGAATTFAIAAQSELPFPLLGVGGLGIVPSQGKTGFLPDVDPAPEGDRVVIPDIGKLFALMFGPIEYIDDKLLTADALFSSSQAGVKSEIKEFEKGWYNRLTQEIFPAVKVPVQYLAAEYEIAWQGLEEAQPRFDRLAKLFTAAPYVEAELLPKGGHNYEFSKSSSKLLDLRLDFISKMIERSKSYSSAFSSIPVLDFAQSLSPSTKPEFLANLRAALVNVGFFYLTNPLVSPTIQSEFVQKGIELFDLPLEKKLEIEMVNSPHFLGYSKLGAEITALKTDYREQFDFATELPAPGPHEPLFRNIIGPNQWPDEEAIPGFRDSLEQYLAEVSRLAVSFISLVAEALDLPPTALDQAFETPQQHKLKIIKYPTPATDNKPESRFQGVGPHKDSEFLTFLLQATPHHGLEVQNKAGDWVSAPPIPDSFVVNIGRALEALTGGVCTATTHRVSLRSENFVDSDGNDLGPRFSFPVFQGVSPNLSADKIDLVIPKHIRDLVKDEKVKSDAEATFNQMFRTCIGEGNLVARVTSHQDVGQRWYPDILAKALKGQQDFLAR
ncbi:Major facilitator superfamily domain general substrate transporter [Penicillium angulare]|uniref:Major facilitator superfamily domain general substrate transporter n=1 Tax=Penicillium angulare TaxID=116970 RepID=A0A9W9GBN3_9EURO|nr:Major facilitator superfamily domain general substrate transporter [Penicillium angulare]